METKLKYRIIPLPTLEKMSIEEVTELYNSGVISNMTYLERMQVGKPAGSPERQAYIRSIRIKPPTLL